MRRALLVGIDRYRTAPQLYGCVSDAEALEGALVRNDDRSPNYRCELLTSEKDGAVEAAHVRHALERLFDNPNADVLFYFSGHGTANSWGGHLMMHGSTQHDPGFPMSELVLRANQFARASRRNVLIMLDCCYAGAAGNDDEMVGNLEDEARLQEGVTILAAARPRQKAVETVGHGAFTRLVLGALDGGAADVRGRVSAAPVYAYAEAVLGALDQRPIYKSHAASLEPIRRCYPAVPDDILRQLPGLFPQSDDVYKLAPSYERKHPDAVPEHVALFQTFKRLQVAQLLRCESGLDMYDTALAFETVLLTPLGRFYWELADAGQL
ncbi:caspase family protein [Sphingomonas sp. UV9]|uniref:caspase family protein n=1 Tax=Sphingomonas sp. UV9 TaxID=1851410 RepID=UPI000FFB0BF7|nr:caspase family protein [Sphingomonas sp. UV9]RXD04881.1 caspase family protein [Sphingomonas sp. UV9]